ncbi:metalloprotease [Infundibulicybe gibba]|nr:metalloprotease [Infundibulicybe gibba]
MFTFYLFVLVLSVLISGIFGTPLNNTLPRACGTSISDDKVLAAEEHFQAHRIKPNATFLETSGTVSVFFHVISKDNTTGGGNVPDSQLTAQISVMNAAYASSGVQWTIAGIIRTVNPDWFSNVGPDSPQQMLMKNTLRQGDEKVLNVYTVGFNSGAGLLGYSTFPIDYADAPNDDGVVILFSTLPGGSSNRFNLGKTLTHEAGHWVGLYHTFQGGCSGAGDLVTDTPPEALPSSGCPVGRTTCSGGPADPIHNFMDYSDDACMDEFTPGQVARIQSQMLTYRGIQL